jgi:hypothetical protein
MKLYDKQRKKQEEAARYSQRALKKLDAVRKDANLKKFKKIRKIR